MSDERKAVTDDTAPAAEAPAPKKPTPLSDEEARAVLSALDPFWTRGIIRDPERAKQPGEMPEGN